MTKRSPSRGCSAGRSTTAVTHSRRVSTSSKACSTGSNRRALPAPDAERPELAEAFVAPRTPAEKSLASIWTKLLGIDRIGINDNYFELGGDSLLATQLVSQVRSVFEVELPLVELFRHPTLAEMATSIEEAIIEQMEDISDEEAEQLLRNEL